MAMLNNCALFYAKVDPKRPNKRFDKENPTWEVQLRTTDRNQKKAWEALGLPVKAVVPDEGEPYFRLNLKKRIKKRDGTDSSPVDVIDHALRPLDPRIIGNGSIGNVRIFQYEKADKSGKVAVLMGIQIVKLVKFTPKNLDDEFQETEGMPSEEADQDDAGGEEGFTAATPAAETPAATTPKAPSPSVPGVKPKPSSAF